MWRPLILVGLCLLLAVRADERVQSHDPATTALPSLVPIKELEQQLKEAVSDIKHSASETTKLAVKAASSAKTAREKADETSHNVQELGQESLKTIGDTRSAINTAVAEQRRLIEQHEQEENKRRAQEEAFKTGADSKDAVADQKRQFSRAHKQALREMARKEKQRRKQKKLHRREVKAKKLRRKHEREHKKRARLAMTKRRKAEERERKQYAREEKIEREEEKRERLEEQKAEQAQLKQEELDEKKAQLEADAHHKAEAAAENTDYKQEFGVSFLESSIALMGKESLPGEKIPVNNKVDRARHPGAHPDTLFSVHPAVSDILDIDAVTPQQKEQQAKALAKLEARKKRLILLRHRAKALEFKTKNARRNAERNAKVAKRRRRFRRIRNRLRRHVSERKHKAMVARRKRCERRKKQKKRQEERGRKRREKYRKYLKEKREKTQAKARELKQKTEAKKKAAERKAKAIAAKIREAKQKHAQHQNLVRERTVKWEQFKVKSAQGAAAEKQRRHKLLEQKMAEAKQKAAAAAVDAGAQQSRQGLAKLKEIETKSQTKWKQQQSYWAKVDEGRHKSWATQRRQHDQWMAEQRQFDLKLRAHLAWWKIQGRWEIRAKQAQRDYTESTQKYKETNAKHAAMARDLAEKKAKHGQRERSRKAHPHYQKLRALRLKKRLARQRRREAKDKRGKERGHKVSWRKNFEASWKQFTERSAKSAQQDQQREKQFNGQVLAQEKKEEADHKSWYEQQNKRLEQLQAGEIREKAEMRAKSDASDVQERNNKHTAIARQRQKHQERKAKFEARRQRYRGDKKRRERSQKKRVRGRVSPKICRRRVVKLYRRFHRRDPPVRVFQRHYSTCLARSCNRACLKRRIRRSPK